MNNMNKYHLYTTNIGGVGRKRALLHSYSFVNRNDCG